MSADMEDPQLASRTESDVRSDVGFFGSGPERLFGSLQSPVGEIKGGMVICPPLHADFSKDYANEVLLSWELARKGFAALRFHHRGQGHSDGDTARMTYDSLTEDALAAVDFLRSVTGVTNVGLIGCRLGGLIAAEASAASEGAAIGLWEPVMEPSSYLREAIRARVIADLSGGRRDGVSSEALTERLQRDGWIDIHGYPIHRLLMESFEGKNLRQVIRPGGPPVLLVAVSRGKSLRAEYAATVSEWANLGVDVMAHQIIGDVAWWFRGGPEDREQSEVVTLELVPRTVAWVASTLLPLQASA